MIYRYINIKNNVSKRSDLVCLIKHVIVLLRENDSGWHSSAVKIQRHKKKLMFQMKNCFINIQNTYQNISISSVWSNTQSFDFMKTVLIKKPSGVKIHCRWKYEYFQ